MTRKIRLRFFLAPKSSSTCRVSTTSSSSDMIHLQTDMIPLYPPSNSIYHYSPVPTPTAVGTSAAQKTLITVDGARHDLLSNRLTQVTEHIVTWLNRTMEREHTFYS